MLHAKIIDTSKNESIEISKAENFLNQSKFGAVIYFVGTVRDLNENKIVTGITYDAKDSMVIRSFEEIYEEADNKLNIKDILNPYFTTKKKGTGLGLSIVNKIINDHNGELKFISIPEGAKIEVNFKIHGN